jgi:hypothetical protein
MIIDNNEKYLVRKHDSDEAFLTVTALLNLII